MSPIFTDVKSNSLLIHVTQLVLIIFLFVAVVAVALDLLLLLHCFSVFKEERAGSALKAFSNVSGLLIVAIALIQFDRNSGGRDPLFREKRCR